MIAVACYQDILGALNETSIARKCSRLPACRSPRQDARDLSDLDLWQGPGVTERGAGIRRGRAPRIKETVLLTCGLESCQRSGQFLWGGFRSELVSDQTGEFWTDCDVLVRASQENGTD